MEGERVNDIWCMGVISHGYGGFGEGGWRRQKCGTKPGRVRRMSGDDGAHPECEVKTLITPTSRFAALGRVDLKKPLTQDTTRKLRFVVHVAG